MPYFFRLHISQVNSNICGVDHDCLKSKPDRCYSLERLSVFLINRSNKQFSFEYEEGNRQTKQSNKA